MSAHILADTEYGAVRGTEMISALGSSFNAFLGIPFAEPPIGDLRFKVG